ncbi:hypothetical protein BVX93_02110, partial [bacterium B13(2017)]
NKKDVALVSVKDAIDTKSAGGRIVLNVLASISQWERESIDAGKSEAPQQKRTEGEKTGGRFAPFGYDINGVIQKQSKDGKDYVLPRLKINSEEQLIINRIKYLNARGYSLGKIAQILKDKGYKTKSGTINWQPITVSRILNSPQITTNKLDS